MIPAAHEATRSYDTEYRFRQDSDFWYLTGFPEPDAVAVIDPSNKKAPFTRSTSGRAIWRWKRGLAVAKAPKAQSKTTAPISRSPIDKFAADLAKAARRSRKALLSLRGRQGARSADPALSFRTSGSVV